MINRRELVYIGIGSNLGRKKNNINKAINLITFNKRNRLLKRSSFVKSKPQGYKNQPDFINAVISIETSFSPLQLLEFLKEIEKKLGRVKTFINGPRIIDLDILLYGTKKISLDKLEIPHPRMFKRCFVVKPLKEVLRFPKGKALKEFNDYKDFIYAINKEIKFN